MERRIMVQYWITTSNWYDQHEKSRPCSGAFDREKQQIWWYHRDRDNINPDDKAIIYQPSKNNESSKENIIIDRTIEKCFIGNFTIDKIIEKSDHLIPTICWTESYDGWLKTKEKNFLWSRDKIIKRKNVDDDLLLKITKRKNVGRVFQNRTWIPITKEYYELVMKKII